MRRPFPSGLAEEGMVPVPGGEVWYRIVGDADQTPVLCLHGGPGLPHGYIDSLADLSEHRPVVFYDQLGCGRSERPNDPALWTVDRSVEELQCVRDALGLKEVHLFGSSWGGMLAFSYVLSDAARTEGVASLTIAGAPVTSARWVEYSRELVARLPGSARATIESHLASGWYSCPEFLSASAVFFKRHLCRSDSWPAGLEEAFQSAGGQVYRTMWGRSEFGEVTGVLRGFDLLDRLPEVEIPTLLTIGRHDQCPISHYEEMADALPDAEMVVFEEGSHMHFFEERALFMQTMGAFLSVHDAR